MIKQKKKLCNISLVIKHNIRIVHVDEIYISTLYKSRIFKRDFDIFT